MIRIETPEQFSAAIKTIEPIYVISKTRGRVCVPCATTLLVRTELVVANVYNPNAIPEDRMALLLESILQNGFCFPVVSIFDEEQGRFVIIDGFHRKLISGPEWLDLDYLPLVVLNHTMAERMTATMQFNRARGVHQVDLDAEVVRALIGQGLSEEDIASKLGMDLDSVHRYKQLTGVAELFKNTDYSMAWEMVDEQS